MRTEVLLQLVAVADLRAAVAVKELTVQQDDQAANSALEKQALELEEKARLLAEQNKVEALKNREVDEPASLEEKAEQLALISSTSRSSSPTCRTSCTLPLNNLLILAKLPCPTTRRRT